MAWHKGAPILTFLKLTIGAHDPRCIGVDADRLRSSLNASSAVEQ